MECCDICLISDEVSRVYVMVVSLFLMPMLLSSVQSVAMCDSVLIN